MSETTSTSTADANIGQATQNGGAVGSVPVNGASTTATGATATTQATVTTGGSFRDFIGEDGKFKTGWAKALGGTDQLEAKFTEPKALVGSYQNLEKLISAKGIIPPGPNATAEEKGAFYKALGRPEKPEDYGISKAPDKLGDKPFPKELWDQARADGFSKVAHEIGLTKEQAAKLADFDMSTGQDRFAKFNEIQEKAQTDAVATLKSEWGSNYDQNLKLAQEAAKQAGGAELLAHPLANDPMFIKAMAKVGGMIVEKPAAGARGMQSATLDPKAEIAAIMNDKNHAWQPGNAKQNPKAHEDAVQHMHRLYQLAYPG